MARLYSQALPVDHPYRFLPSWMPYSIAKGFSALVRVVNRCGGDNPASQ
ncbi:hypothetical protein MWN34_03585 [Ancylobacter sp. 6x-1]|uniref:Uncharacterized protein n=1 Tax=Ancylobacter crimeensis TaxID=2579147 RepID=A0ABT0D7R1_9HYPH|nr:hypothetical protein [Ancylobacter crimeensis]MCK0195988.1 hypothetical protein [Ancylobacter crimeensis]